MDLSLTDLLMKNINSVSLRLRAKTTLCVNYIKNTKL